MIECSVFIGIFCHQTTRARVKATSILLNKICLDLCIKKKNPSHKLFVTEMDKKLQKVKKLMARMNQMNFRWYGRGEGVANCKKSGFCCTFAAFGFIFFRWLHALRADEYFIKIKKMFKSSQQKFNMSLVLEQTSFTCTRKYQQILMLSTVPIQLHEWTSQQTSWQKCVTFWMSKLVCVCEVHSKFEADWFWA